MIAQQTFQRIASPFVPDVVAPSMNSKPRKPRRASSFDRAPEPHDWRWIVGGLGRLLISIGLLMFGFVGYQLWGTGIATAQAQGRLETEFDQLLTTPTTPGGTTSEQTTTSAAPPTTGPLDPGATTTAPLPSTTLVESTTTTPGASVPGDGTFGPPQNYVIGSAVARLVIPDIGVDFIVISGARTEDLKVGPGHFPETPLPGRLGNAALAGHRTTYGAPFSRVDELQIGDRMTVTTVEGTFTYSVTGTEIVASNDYAKVIPTVDPTRATITLISCHPKYTARQRIVVHGELVAAESDIPLPPPADLPRPQGPTDELPGDNPPDVTDPASGIPDNGSGSVGTGTAPDGLGGGWFNDSDAWTPVALWGSALAAIGLGAYLVSRKLRRNWVGALVGIVPFVVALYFFFENLIRLMPSAL